MMIRVYGLNVRSRPAAIALAAAALALGAVFLAFGILLLVGLAAVGTLVGAGVMLFRRVTGRAAGQIRSGHFDAGLDPSLEVFPERASPNSAPHELPSPQAHGPDKSA